MKDGQERSILSVLGSYLDARQPLPPEVLDELHTQAKILREERNSRKLIEEARDHNFDPKKYQEIINYLANSKYNQLILSITSKYKSGVIDLEKSFRENDLASLVSLYPNYKHHMGMERLMLANPAEDHNSRTTFVHEMFSRNCPKEAIIHYFKELDKLARLNPALMSNYLALSDTDGKSIRQILDEKSLTESYLGISERIKSLCRALYPVVGRRGAPAANILTVDTHTESTHGSVDQSFVRLALVYDPGLIRQENERKVSVTRDSKWNDKIQQSLEALVGNLRAILVSDASIDEFIASTLIEGEDKAFARAQFKFQAETALRLVDGLKAGGYGNRFPVAANEEVACGLTPKEIVAIGYASLENRDLWNNPTQGKQQFMQLVENLYIAKRGYNIDRDGADEWTKTPVELDDNKCTGGAINQVAYGLKDHMLVEVKIITTETMAPVLSKKLADILVSLTESSERVAIINNWLATGTLNDSLTTLILTEFQKDEEFSQEFSQSEIRSIGARVLNQINKENLNNLKMELQNKLPAIFSQSVISSEGLLDKERIYSFDLNPDKGYVPYLESLYHLDQDRFNAALRTILPPNDAYSNDFNKMNVMLNLLLGSQDEHMVTATKAIFQSYLREFNQETKNQYLILMADHNHTHLLEPLVTAGASVRGRDRRGGHPDESALHHAANNGNVDAIAKLVALGADVNDLDSKGETALHYAAASNKVDAIAKLVELGADINAKSTLMSQTALHSAAENSKVDAIAKLVELGADIATEDKCDRTALQIAAKGGNIDAIATTIIKISSDIPVVIKNVIKQNDDAKDDPDAWKLVEAIIIKLDPNKRVEIVSEIYGEIDDTSRRDLLLSFIPEHERNIVRAQVSALEVVLESRALAHGNSSEDVSKRAEKSLGQDYTR